jgi:hypothetical protein
MEPIMVHAARRIAEGENPREIRRWRTVARQLFKLLERTIS